MANPLLHLSDWNYQDKYYRVDLPTLKELVKKTKEAGTNAKFNDIWDWFIDQEGTTHVKRLQRVNTNELGDAYFLDYNNPFECALEWEQHWADNP